MTLITLPSGTVLANDSALPIIVISKVLMANDTNPHAKLYPYYFTIMYANGVSIPIIAKTLADAELDRQMLVKAITPMKDSNVNYIIGWRDGETGKHKRLKIFRSANDLAGSIPALATSVPKRVHNLADKTVKNL